MTEETEEVGGTDAPVVPPDSGEKAPNEASTDPSQEEAGNGSSDDSVDDTEETVAEGNETTPPEEGE